MPNKDFANFIKGDSKNNMNVAGLMFLIVMILPSFLLDMVLIFLYFFLPSWFDYTSSTGLAPFFTIFGFACFVLNGFNIFLLCRAIRNSRDPRVAEDDTPR